MDILNFSGLGWPAPLLLPVAFAIADRLWGAAKPAFKGKKAVIAAVVLGAGIVAGGLPGALLGLLWLVQRSIGFFASSATKGGPALIRHGLVVPFAGLIGFWAHRDPLAFGWPFAAYALIAAGLAAYYGHLEAKAIRAGEPIGRQNTVLEPVRGAAYGFAALIALS